ncbi:MAG: hypothetical protein ABIE55_02855 [Candidatus Aenigmatarchaeota archaeon]
MNSILHYPSYEYPFSLYVDGHLLNDSKVSLGILVEDNDRVKIQEIYDVKTVSPHTTFMAEATANFDAIITIPHYCNKIYCKKYGNGDNRVSISSDCRQLVDLMGRSKNVAKSLNKENNGLTEAELEILEKKIKDVQDIRRSYNIKYKEIKSENNPAHQLCRLAEYKYRKKKGK